MVGYFCMYLFVISGGVACLMWVVACWVCCSLCFVIVNSVVNTADVVSLFVRFVYCVLIGFD